MNRGRAHGAAGLVGISVLVAVVGALLWTAWVYRDLPALDETVAPMRGERDGGGR